MSPQELILQLRRARSLVRTAAMLARGGPSAQRAVAQAAVGTAQQVLQQQLGATGAAAAAARLGMKALASEILGTGGALAVVMQGLPTVHPLVREAMALRRVLEGDAHPAVVQLRLERMAAALAPVSPSASAALRSILVKVREVESQIQEALRMQRQAATLWAELRGLVADLSTLAL